MDIAEALTKTKNPQVYWATVKRRNPQLIAICKQLKLKAKDGKFYNTDVVDESGLNTVLALIPGFIFGGLYDFAGQIRKLNIGFMFFCVLQQNEIWHTQYRPVKKQRSASIEALNPLWAITTPNM